MTAVKVYVSVDMEGIAGVNHPHPTNAGHERYPAAVELMIGEANAAIEGAFDGGATEVLVNEAHATMRNLLLEDLDERAQLLTGRHKDLTMVEGVQHPGVAGAAFVGYHTGAGAEGVLAHTYLANSITGVWVDGTPASEGYLNALVCAEFGVPVVLVTGDDLACRDAAGYAPDAATAAVKDCVTRYAAVCRPPAVTFAAIRDAAGRGAALAGRRDPAAPGSRVVEVEFDAAHLAQAVSLVPSVERTAVRRVAYASPSAYDLIRTFKTVTTMAAAAVEATYG